LRIFDWEEEQEDAAADQQSLIFNRQSSIGNQTGVNDQWKSRASGGRRGGPAVADAPLQVMRFPWSGFMQITAMSPRKRKTQEWRGWIFDF
jgi:hypothetical protein